MNRLDLEITCFSITHSHLTFHFESNSLSLFLTGTTFVGSFSYEFLCGTERMRELLNLLNLKNTDEFKMKNIQLLYNGTFSKETVIGIGKYSGNKITHYLVTNRTLNFPYFIPVYYHNIEDFLFKYYYL